MPPNAEAAAWRKAVQYIADLLVGNFNASFQNELRFMGQVGGSKCAQLLKTQGVPMQQVAKHTAGTLARL